MTIQFPRTNGIVADQANPNDLPDILRKFALGTMFAKATEQVVSQTAATTMTLSPPAIGGTLVVRVTAGAAAAGLRQIGDSAATPSATVAALSANGATLTFEGTVSGAIISYIARPGGSSPVDFTALFAT